MKTNEPSASIGEEKKATEYLANERTFLAWIRTSIAIISLGFVVAKFTVWLRELAIRFDPQASTGGTGASLPIGVGMMAVGGIFAALAARRYHLVNRNIEEGKVQPDRGLVYFVAAVVVFLSLAMIIYMFCTSQQA
jgi:putative membrane protein